MFHPRRLRKRQRSPKRQPSPIRWVAPLPLDMQERPVYSRSDAIECDLGDSLDKLNLITKNVARMHISPDAKFSLKRKMDSLKNAFYDAYEYPSKRPRLQ